jgi:hypothetical protein
LARELIHTEPLFSLYLIFRYRQVTFLLPSGEECGIIAQIGGGKLC